MITIDAGAQYAYLYLDGELIGTQSRGRFPLNAADLVGIGCAYTGSGIQDQPFKGWIAAARIYDRVLTTEEIQLLASEFTPTTT